MKPSIFTLFLILFIFLGFTNQAQAALPQYSCNELYSIIQNSWGSQQGDANFNQAADLRQDGEINAGDLQVYGDHTTDGTICYISSCAKLKSILDDAWHSTKGQSNFDERVDLRHDGVIDAGDLQVYGDHTTDETFCQQKLTTVQNSCTKLQSIMNQAWGSQQGSLKFDPAVDLRQDGEINAGDLQVYGDHTTDNTICFISNCSQLKNILDSAWNSAQGDPNFDERADLRQDGEINAGDLQVYGDHTTDDAFCSQRLNMSSNDSDPAPTAPSAASVRVDKKPDLTINQIYFTPQKPVAGKSFNGSLHVVIENIGNQNTTQPQ